VVDDDLEFGIGFDQGVEVGQAGDRDEERHGNFELRAAKPEGRHERAANPVSVRRGGGAKADAVESIFFGKAGEMVGGGGVFGIDAADAVELAG
jgi:hypothetical protein